MIRGMATSEILETITVTQVEHDAIVAAAVHSVDFMMCGQRFRLCADDPETIKSFCRTYDGFRCPLGSTASPAMTMWAVRLKTPVPSITFIVCDRVYRTVDEGLLADPFPVLDHLLIKHIRTHYLVHAGCVSRCDRGIIVSGASHMGKTTLTTFLVSRGMGFLSDEISPISRVDGSVTPFPMELGIRSGPAATLVDAVPGTAFECGNDRKKMVDARHLNRTVVRNAIPLHAVVFLTSRLSADVSTARKFDGVARVMFGEMNEMFLSAILEQTHSVLLTAETPAPGLFTLLLRSLEPMGFLEAVRKTADEHSIPLFLIEYEDLDTRDFNSEPKLLKLPAAAGVMELIKKIPSSQKAELVRTQFEGSVARLIEELSGIVRDVGFYKLTTGRLDAMLQAIETLP